MFIHQDIKYSKQLSRAGYDPEARELRIYFPNGSVYAYKDVPPNVYTTLVSQASSKASEYFNSNIKHSFEYKKL